MVTLKTSASLIGLVRGIAVTGDEKIILTTSQGIAVVSLTDLKSTSQKAKCQIGDSLSLEFNSIVDYSHSHMIGFANFID
jgi:hypothetical protein